MKRSQWLMWLLLAIFICISIVTTNYNAIAKTDYNDSKSQFNYEEYKNAITQYYNIEIKTDDVIEKTTEIRKILYKIPDSSLESFSCNKDNAQIRLYIPLKNEDIVMKLFSEDKDLSNFSSSSSNIGNDFMNYYEKYKFYELLLNNFDKVKNIIYKDSCNKIDAYKLKKMLEDNKQNFERSLEEYKKKLNTIYLQVYIRKEK